MHPPYILFIKFINQQSLM